MPPVARLHAPLRRWVNSESLLSPGDETSGFGGHGGAGGVTLESMAALYGVHENIDPAATAGLLGGNATRIFTPGVISPRDLVAEVTAKCSATWAAGMTAVWSFKPLPDAVASGAWKPYVLALGQYLAANPTSRTVVIIWHEPENDVPKWFGSAAAFVSLFDTVAGWLRQTWPHAVVVHAALAYRYGDGRDITDQVAPHWRTSADIHCADVYSGRSNPLNTILPELSSYRRWRRFVAQDSPWGITERGWTVGTDTGPTAASTRASAMAREVTWLGGLPAGGRPQIYLMWNTGGTEGDAGLVFDGAAERIARSAMTTVAAVPAPATPTTPATVTVAPVTTAAAPAKLVPLGTNVRCPHCGSIFPLTAQ